ncbi:MAG: SUMF1/EgtB/PvdO family nonheme iron enzyme [Bryobacterales bacterium]|nr:SUMF1/EgtB/PvdO family nonheme iron enzyme [Bryobacterales bacterium]
MCRRRLPSRSTATREGSSLGRSFSDGLGRGATWKTPLHEVLASEFSSGKRPVTFAEFRAFRPAHPNPPHVPQDVDVSAQPVTAVSGSDARPCCRWLSEQTGRRYRPPTEAEWKKAIFGARFRLGDKWLGIKASGALSAQWEAFPW